MSRIDLIECFKDTQAFSLKELSEDTEQAIASGKVYPEGFKAEERELKEAGKILVEEMSSFDAARKYISFGKTAVLNFANPVHPGGGVTNGAMAQEEALCRSSNLYLCLISGNVYGEYYGYHKRADSYSASDRLIYNTDICVFKDDQTNPQYLRKEEWIHVDILTSAAPYNSGRYQKSEEELKEIFTSRIQNILEAAVDNDVQVLILGAFGCGAFRNPPSLVSEVFKEVIETGNYTQKIPYLIFAIKRSGNENYEVFRKCFQKDG